MIVCMRYTISGRVQGVFFRASTQREARSLGVTGYAKNLPDGSVEVLACGSASAVEQLREWLWVGPPAARVSHVHCAPTKADVSDEFTIS